MAHQITSIKVTDEKPCYALAGSYVNVLVNADRGQAHGSSRVKLKNIVDYKWEAKKYHGRLIAVHRDRQVIAYSIKLKTGGMVRVVWNGERALIKGMSTEVLDLQFANMSSKVLLGCIDDRSLHVYRVDTTSGKLDTQLVLKVDNAVEDVPIASHRLNWCPYTPTETTSTAATTTTSDGGNGAAVEGADDEYANHMLVWCQGDTFQALNVHLITEECGLGVTHDLADLTEGVITHRESKAHITVATISPDGTTMAVGYDDGHVYFYQMYFYSKQQPPRRLHHWQPHESRPVTALAFLDDHSRPQMPEDTRFWQYALTATDLNTELRLWRCRDWTCTQRICFKPTVQEARLDFKLDIDPASSYVVLSEQTNRVLYALQIDRQEGTTADPAFKAVGEFPLSSSILSFSIAGAAKGKYNCGRLEEDDEEYGDLDMDEEAQMAGVMLQMFLVQPKSVQECQVFFQTEGAAQPETVDTVSCDDMMLSTPTTVTSTTNRQKSSAQINLMSPESFQSAPQPAQSSTLPKQHQPDQTISNSVLDTIRMLAAATFGTPAGDSTAPTTTTTVKEPQMLSYAAIEEQNLKKSLAVDSTTNSTTTTATNSTAVSSSNGGGGGNATTGPVILPSGNSSPSREVQEILSLKDEMFENHMQLSDVDMEFEGNSSNGVGNEDDEDDEEEDSDDNRLAKAAVNQANAVGVQVMEGINAINRFVDDDDDEEDDEDVEVEKTKKKADTVKDWPQVPNILPDISKLGAAIVADPAISQLNNLNVVDSTDGGHNNHTSRVVLEKLDQLLARIEALEKRPPTQVIPAQDVTAVQENVVRAANMAVTETVAREMKGLHALVQFELGEQKRAMREAVAQTCNGKALAEAFSGAIRQAVQTQLQPAMQDQVAKVLVPACERVTRELFRQTNDQFQKGVNAYGKQVQGYMAQFQPVHEQQERLVAALGGLPEQFRVTSEKAVNGFSAQIIHEVNKDFRTLQLNVLKMVKDTVKTEVHKGFESQAASLEDSVRSAVRSTAQTPSVFDVQEQIRQLIAQGQVNKAFHQALISNDLNLVEYTLQQADTKDVFNPCRLEQTVLLSLIQQLSADMSAYTNAKHQYLSEAITSLNMGDTVIREHAPKILKQLAKNLHKYCEERPNGEFGSRIRMLQMMIQGFSVHLTS